MRLTVLSILGAALLPTLPALAQAPEAAKAPPVNAITAAAPVLQHPTLLCLGVQWFVEGDDNRNATAAVAFRARGAEPWREGMPLLRIRGETAMKQEKTPWSAPNLFAGSVIDLKPDSEYEVKLTLSDPDGVQAKEGVGKMVDGKLEIILAGRTRGEPKAFEGGKKVHVYPGDFAGKKEAAAPADLRAAIAAAQPGEIVLLHAGTYTVPEAQKKERTDYLLTRGGTADRPIVFRAAGDGEVILDGKGALKLVDCQKADYLWFEEITFTGADHLIYAGRSTGSVGLVVKRCKFLDRAHGVFALHPACKDFYIADSEFIGPAKAWHPRKGGSDNHAIWLMGQGHVVCYNRIDSWWDGIDFAGGNPGPDPAQWNGASDWYGNDISRCMDDGVECDYSVHNLRVFRNRFWNCFMAISFQPVYAGPCYAFRNVVYNTTRSPIKPNQDPAGLMIFNNTFIAHGSAGRWSPMWQNSRILNNLFLGTDGAEGVIWTGTPTPETSAMDYNGWHFFKHAGTYPIWWKFAAPRRVWSGSGLTDECVFRDLKQFVEDTGFEKHGRMVTPEVFVKYCAPTGGEAPLPELDLRLKPDGVAVDAGTPIPLITDGFKGAAPDLGAIEAGEETPKYGPRAK
jgi:hypothetical protein